MGILLEKESKMSRLQVICQFMAVIDIFLYFGTIITSVVVENSITEMRPMKIQITDNGTVTVSFTEKNELMAIWDYLDPVHYNSSSIYNAVYMTLVVVAVSYFIVEIWLSCVLIRGATERSVGHCKKWFWWRMGILFATILVSASDLCQMQYTLTLLLFIPLNIFRMALAVLVLHLITEYNAEGNVGKLKPLA